MQLNILCNRIKEKSHLDLLITLVSHTKSFLSHPWLLKATNKYLTVIAKSAQFHPSTLESKFLVHFRLKKNHAPKWSLVHVKSVRRAMYCKISATSIPLGVPWQNYGLSNCQKINCEINCLAFHIGIRAEGLHSCKQAPLDIKILKAYM